MKAAEVLMYENSNKLSKIQLIFLTLQNLRI